MPYRDKEDKKKYDAAYREAHKEDIAAYREAHKEETREYHNAYYEANREEINARNSAWLAKYPIRKMLYGAKRRAIAAGLSFDLVETDIHIPELCPVFKTLLVRGTRENRANPPSLDRIDSTKGYTRGMFGS